MHPLPSLTRSVQRWGLSLSRAAALGITLTLGCLALSVGVQACGSDASGTTGGKRIVLHTRVAVNEAATTGFTIAVGWHITLSKALVSAGPFYYFDGAPALAVRAQRKGWEYAARFLTIGSARAHPGHYQAGNALGQMLESASVDLLGGARDLPDGEGVTGTYRSARFTFAEPAGAGSAALAGYVALAEGKAEKAGQNPRFFRAVADLESVAKSASQAHIEGCEFSDVEVEREGTVTVTVNPAVWFDLVDFAEAEEASAPAPADLPTDSQPQIAFVLGVTQLSAYNFSYSSP